jgi:hypothetical protein
VRGEARNSFSRAHGRLLSSRAGLRRTFGGMLTCTSLLMLGLGGYLIEDQFADPLASNPAALFFAAALIACGLILLSYVIHPGARHESKAVASEILDLPAGRPAIEITARHGAEGREEQRDLALPSRYVDHARIRP